MLDWNDGYKMNIYSAEQVHVIPAVGSHPLRSWWHVGYDSLCLLVLMAEINKVPAHRDDRLVVLGARMCGGPGEGAPLCAAVDVKGGVCESGGARHWRSARLEGLLCVSGSQRPRQVPLVPLHVLLVRRSALWAANGHATACQNPVHAQKHGLAESMYLPRHASSCPELREA